MKPVDALSKILFHLVESVGHLSGTSAPIGRQASRILDDLRGAGFAVVPTAHLESIVKAGTWSGTDDNTYTSKECRIAKDALGLPHD